MEHPPAPLHKGETNFYVNKYEILNLSTSIVEQFERELESHGIEFSIHAADESADIEDMRTDAITQLDLRFQVRHKQNASIQTLVLNHAQPSVQGTQQDKRRLIGDMASPIPTGGVEPLPVQKLEGTSYFIVPSFRDIAPAEIDIIDKVNVVHFGKQSESGTIAQCTNLVKFDFLLHIKLHTFVFIITTEHTFQSSFIVQDESGHTGAYVHLSFAVHIIIHARRPLDANARGKTIIGGTEIHVVQQAPSGLRDEVRQIQMVPLDERAPMHGGTRLNQQAVHRLDAVENIQVYVLEIVQIQVLEIDGAVRNGA